MSIAYLEEAKDYLKLNTLNTHFEKLASAYKLRDELIPKYSFAIPNEEAIKEIASLHVPIIEIGAGTGYWASLLNAQGVDIICFDTFQGKYSHGDWRNRWFKVEKGGVEKVRENPDRALFLCWPDYNTNTANDCLKNYTSEFVIYIGEDRGGCTADNDFFDTIEKDFELYKQIEIPQWQGIHDMLYIFKRKNPVFRFQLVDLK
jgi:hypothetical protein